MITVLQQQVGSFLRLEVIAVYVSLLGLPCDIFNAGLRSNLVSRRHAYREFNPGFQVVTEYILVPVTVVLPDNYIPGYLDILLHARGRADSEPVIIEQIDAEDALVVIPIAADNGISTDRRENHSGMPLHSEYFIEAVLALVSGAPVQENAHNHT
jgi:hypothetical protein